MFGAMKQKGLSIWSSMVAIRHNSGTHAHRRRLACAWAFGGVGVECIVGSI